MPLTTERRTNIVKHLVLMLVLLLLVCPAASLFVR
jgi:hypothetical protein